MIIEFLGVSGVGKTTVALKYKEQLESEGKNVVWDTYELYARYSWFIRNVMKATSVIAYSVSHLRWVRDYYIFLRKNIPTLRDRIKPLFNAIFLKTLLQKARQDNRIHIFDEGVLQNLWAVKLRGNKIFDNQDFETMSMLFGISDYLIVVDANVEVIANRITKRGEYVRIMDSDDLINTIIVMQSFQEEIIKYSERFIKIERYHND